MKNKNIIDTILLVVIITLTGTQVKSQDCKGIKTTKDEMAGIIKTESTTTFMGPKIQAVKIIKDSKETSFIYFSLTWPVKNYESKGIIVKFSDSTFVREEAAKVDCSLNTSTGSYTYSGSIQMSDTYIEKFSSSKIVMFRVGEGQNKVGDKFSEKFMGYVKCIYMNK